jgi:hypothetical protein
MHLDQKDDPQACVAERYVDKTYLQKDPSLWYLDPLANGAFYLSSYWRRGKCNRYVGSPYSCSDPFARLYLNTTESRPIAQVGVYLAAVHFRFEAAHSPNSNYNIIISHTKGKTLTKQGGNAAAVSTAR